MGKKLLIYLKHEVGSFSIKPRHLKRISSAFPGIDILEVSGKEEFNASLPEADWILTWQFRVKMYGKLPKLEAVFTPAAGKDWLPPDPSGRVINFYGRFHGRIMRESLLAMMLFFNRRLDICQENRNNKVWDRSYLDGSSLLCGQRALIVGYGAIGRQMAELLRAFGMRVVAVKRNIAGFERDPHAERVITFADMDEELSRADHVVLMLPGSAETENLFSKRHFFMMKPGAFLYNLGRGNCYCEEHLVDALQNGPLAGAGLDVFRQEPLPLASSLWNLPNVLIMPHASAICSEYLNLYSEEFISVARDLWRETQALKL